ncbi:MAG TPA: hypothetical protein VFO94_08265 [Gammaproteobacteria bacterium]|nr:hypothetical protein [Gammaproteobacteria bacterium]
MSGPASSHPGLAALLDYWLGDAAPERASALELHWFACADCAARLEQLAQLCAGVKRLVRSGSVRAVVPAAFVERLRGTGARLREYRLDPGGSVSCTITPEDDFVLAHLRAPLGGVRRLDMLVTDPSGARFRAEDLAFDPAAEGVVVASSTVELRQLGVATLRMQLLSVDDGADHVLGDYTFNHSPHAPSSRAE